MQRRKRIPLIVVKQEGDEDLLPVVEPRVELNDMQLLFIDYYLIHMNATKAAKLAGYSEKTAYSQGHRLLNHAEVQRRIDETMQEQAEDRRITRERVLNEIAKVAMANPRDYMLVDEKTGKAKIDMRVITRDQWAAIAGIDKDGTVKFSDKMRALEMLGKYLKLFTDRHEHSGPEGGPIDTTWNIHIIPVPTNIISEQ